MRRRPRTDRGRQHRAQGRQHEPSVFTGVMRGILSAPFGSRLMPRRTLAHGVPAPTSSLRWETSEVVSGGRRDDWMSGAAGPRHGEDDGCSSSALAMNRPFTAGSVGPRDSRAPPARGSSRHRRPRSSEGRSLPLIGGGSVMPSPAASLASVAPSAPRPNRSPITPARRTAAGGARPGSSSSHSTRVSW